jgi:hypothetical protein
MMLVARSLQNFSGSRAICGADFPGESGAEEQTNVNYNRPIDLGLPNVDVLQIKSPTAHACSARIQSAPRG